LPAIKEVFANKNVQRHKISQVWWYMSTILTIKRLRQEDHEFKATLGYIAKGSFTLIN
jgi:hypothetical protein